MNAKKVREHEVGFVGKSDRCMLPSLMYCLVHVGRNSLVD